MDGALFALLQPTSGDLPNEKPVLNALNVTTRLDAEQEYQFVEIEYSFAAAPPEGTTVRAYLGRPGYMALLSDGSVSGFIKEEFEYNAGEFLFLSPELWASYRVIVVARSPSGFGAAQALSNPPPPPPSPCAGAVAAPGYDR